MPQFCAMSLLCGHSCVISFFHARLPRIQFTRPQMWHNNINASLFLDVATFMKDNGFLDAGYNYITLGGIGYANNSGPGGNITRNAAGMLQVRLSHPLSAVIPCMLCVQPVFI